MSCRTTRSRTCCLLWILVLFHIAAAQALFNFTFEENKLYEVLIDRTQTVTFNLTCDSCDGSETVILTVSTADRGVAVIPENYTRVQPSWRPEEGQWRGEVRVHGVRMGSTMVRFTRDSQTMRGLTDEGLPRLREGGLIDDGLRGDGLKDNVLRGDGLRDDGFKELIDHDFTELLEEEEVDQEIEQVHEERVIVARSIGTVELVYRYGIITFSILIYLGFGAQIDFKVIKKILKKPIGPAIGAVCQFTIMPLLGFGIAMTLGLEDHFAFGLLALACSPGGGGSNGVTNLLEGDVDLSITMTFISTLLSLFFMPFWMFALGRFFTNDRIFVPYRNIVMSLIYIVVPLMVGIGIKWWSARVGKFMVKFVKPITLIFILFMLTYGVYANLYAYEIMVTEPLVITAAILLPYTGFMLGYLVALLFKQKRPQRTAICMETGYQNPSIPIIALTASFPQPEGDLGAVMPLAAGLFTPLLPLGIYAGMMIYRCTCKPAEEEVVVMEPKGDANDVDITVADADLYQITGKAGMTQKAAVGGISNVGFRFLSDDAKSYPQPPVYYLPDVKRPVTFA